jgi:hypothetical protein
MLRPEESVASVFATIPQPGSAVAPLCQLTLSCSSDWRSRFFTIPEGFDMTL